MKILCKDYDYAGFQYTIMKENGIIVAAPHLGQHTAARKAKHIRAAVESYIQEHGA